mmetsp:Transcript_14690/g.45515  ORF Transcript_14690/g.45515 Transcript_14690/m.45515 type:complete len:328 (-) Transcript_14690:1443-2426(-)
MAFRSPDVAPCTRIRPAAAPPETTPTAPPTTPPTTPRTPPVTPVTTFEPPRRSAMWSAMSNGANATDVATVVAPANAASTASKPAFASARSARPLSHARIFGTDVRPLTSTRSSWSVTAPSVRDPSGLAATSRITTCLSCALQNFQDRGAAGSSSFAGVSGRGSGSGSGTPTSSPPPSPCIFARSRVRFVSRKRRSYDAYVMTRPTTSAIISSRRRRDLPMRRTMNDSTMWSSAASACRPSQSPSSSSSSSSNSSCVTDGSSTIKSEITTSRRTTRPCASRANPASRRGTCRSSSRSFDRSHHVTTTMSFWRKYHRFHSTTAIGSTT